MVDESTNRISGDVRRAAAAVSADDDYPSPRSRAVVAMKRATVASLHAHGVHLLLGTDLPNPLMVPGFAIHEELAALVRAGLTPFDAIASGTRDAGRFMGGDRFGTITAGSRADVIIVAQNPLEDVAWLRKPKAVLVRGTWARRLEN
jgi:imidazolonepropionase-like amidohydrolase